MNSSTIHWPDIYFKPISTCLRFVPVVPILSCRTDRYRDGRVGGGKATTKTKTLSKSCRLNSDNGFISQSRDVMEVNERQRFCGETFVVGQKILLVEILFRGRSFSCFMFGEITDL